MQVTGDPEAIPRDEDAIEDDRPPGRVEGHALGLEGGGAGRAAELSGLAGPEPDGRHRLPRPHDDDAQLELEQGSKINIAYRLRQNENPNFSGLELEIAGLERA